MKKYPKELWVTFGRDGIARKVFGIEYLAKLSAIDDGRTKAKRYHLHPGNEVKLKRENAMMRRWLKIIFDVPTGDEMFSVRAEIRAKLPDLFKTKKWGSK